MLGLAAFNRLRWMAKGRQEMIARNVLLELADAENPPLRMLLGSYGLPVIEAVYEQRLQSFRQWYAASAAG